MDDIKLTISGGQVYKAVQNYLVNTAGISKEDIIALVEKRLDSIVRKYLEEKITSGRMDAYLRQVIGVILKDGVQNGSWYSGPQALDQFIKQTLEAHIKDMIVEKFDITVKEKQNV